ncbi:MAG: hypothetical protein CBD74_02875 [Saprospirales bacterium TMED214]|nr:MAG: hypothetical protein CBD74_02875 [Saprospirales bacterium TMED214]
MFNIFKKKSIPATEGKLNFIDVGSAGLLPHPWDNHSNLIDYILKFEPRENRGSYEKAISINTALWNKKCEKQFYIYQGFNGTGSSLFLQNFKYVRENFETLKLRGPKNLAETWVDRSQLVRIESIECESLDNVLDSLDTKRQFDFLKIDAQGAELQILEGAQKFIKTQCQGLFLELFKFPLYEGIALADEVIEYLDARGFQLHTKFPAHGTFESQNDCLFLRKDIDSSRLRIITDVYSK